MVIIIQDYSIVGKDENIQMLNIVYGDMPEAIFNTSLYFDNTYYDSWLYDDFAKKMIKSVDKAEVSSADRQLTVRHWE